MQAPTAVKNLLILTVEKLLLKWTTRAFDKLLSNASLRRHPWVLDTSFSVKR